MFTIYQVTNIEIDTLVSFINLFSHLKIVNLKKTQDYNKSNLVNKILIRTNSSNYYLPIESFTFNFYLHKILLLKLQCSLVSQNMNCPSFK